MLILFSYGLIFQFIPSFFFKGVKLFLKINYLRIYLFSVGLRHHRCVWAFSRCSEPGLPLVEVPGLLTSAASLSAEPRLQAQGLH